MFPHGAEGRFWLSGQMNFVYQANPPFRANYSGGNSFRSNYDSSFGRVLTLYSGYRFAKSSEALISFEEAGGLGLSSAVGIASFPNLDAVRDASLSQAPYLARVMYHGVIALGHDKTDVSRNAFSIFSELPSRRLEVRIGKFSIPDFFDTNAVGGDSHLQFLNWVVDQNGAYDFTADARGYTWGVLTEYQSPKWGARFAEALESGPQNGGPLVWNLRKANTSNFEFELHRAFLKKHDGIVRLLSYINNANMGIYKYANEQYLEGKVPKPNIDDHPIQVTTKYGFGVNLEQSLSKSVTAYGRFGWNNGKTETWSFTEVDQTFSGGVGVIGDLWKRKNDRAGLAMATNGIARGHILYLEYGGLGSVLGDGNLQYGRETSLETYYTAHIWRGLYLGPDFQFVVNPGYNQSRGPVAVGTFRVHIEY
jgi:high affinity Mn2+ porin